MTSSSVVTKPSKAWETHTQGKEEQADRKKKKDLKSLEVSCPDKIQKNMPRGQIQENTSSQQRKGDWPRAYRRSWNKRAEEPTLFAPVLCLLGINSWACQVKWEYDLILRWLEDARKKGTHTCHSKCHPPEKCKRTNNTFSSARWPEAKQHIKNTK